MKKQFYKQVENKMGEVLRSRWFFFFSLLLIIYGLIAIALDLNWVTHSPSNTEGLIIAGMGFVFMLGRHEDSIRNLRRDVNEIRGDIRGEIRDIRKDISEILKKLP